MRELAAGIAVVLVCAGLFLFQPQAVVNLDRRTFDMFAQWTGRGRPSDRIVILEVDEASLAQYGRWPWPRDRIALLVSKVLDYGADTVALDMIFAEPDSTDDALVSAIKSRKVVIGFQFGFQPGAAESTVCSLHPSFLLNPGPEGIGVFRASSALCSLSAITQSAAATGFLNAAPDSDGVLRRVPLLIEYRGLVYPSLALATFLTHSAASTVALRGHPSGVQSLSVGNLGIPLDERGGLLLRFRGPSSTFRSVSAHELLGGRARHEEIRGKIVIVGCSAVGLQDLVSAPMGGLFPGPEVQATALDNLLQGDFLSLPPAGRTVELLLLLVSGLGSVALAASLRFRWALTGMFAAGICMWSGSLQFFSRTGAFVSPLSLTLTLGANLAVLTALSLRREKLRADRVSRRLIANRQFVVHALASLASIRDLETGEHLLRTQHYTRLLCEAVASYPRFRGFLNRETIELLVQLVPLHDIGKVGVPDHILQKPGRLTPEEYEIIKLHVEYGREVLETARVRSGLQDQNLLRLAEQIVFTHHERWDGTGYPRKLRGEEIPIPGRMMAIVDVYDALVSKRVYKVRMTHEQAMALIEEGRGQHFDPDLVAAFLKSHESWRRVAQEFDEDRLKG